MSKVVRGLVTVGVGVAVCAIGVAAPAEAAAKRCIDGKWRFTGENTGAWMGTRDDGTVTQTEHYKGAAGTVLAIKGTKATFDFAKSAKENITIDTDNDQGKTSFALWSLYRGSLTVKVKATGTKSGKLTGYPKTATGTAKAHTVQTKPARADLGTGSLAKSLRKGEVYTLLPFGYPYTCTSKTLKFAFKRTVTDQVNFYRINATLTYKRV